MSVGADLVPPRPFNRGGGDDDRFDDLVKKLEGGVMATSAAEILWGGPNGPGLVFTVTELAKTVERLSDAVAKIADNVSGSDGVEQQLRDARAEIAEQNKEIGSLRDSIHATRAGWVRAAWIAAGTVIPALCWLVFRSVQIAMQGHV